MEKDVPVKIPNPAPCPKCRKGFLLAFLRPRFKDEGLYNPRPIDFSHYEVYYRCSKCGNQIEG